MPAVGKACIHMTGCFGLPFGCLLPKWQDFAIAPLSTLSRIRVLSPT